MANDFVEYLSANVVNEGQTVSYRTLSRALKVHSNLAKQMLYEFHRTQNQNKPGTLHATYLMTGTQSIAVQHRHDGKDTAMRSSPLPSSPAHRDQEAREYTATSVLVVDQDDLDDAKAEFDSLVSIHVYSLQPGKLKDLHALTECNRSVAVDYATEDPLETSKQYGSIQNPQVKRRPLRKQHQQLQPAQTAVPAATSKPTKPVSASMFPTKSSNKDPVKSVGSAKSTPDPTQAPPASASSKSSAPKPAPLKREASSLFKAFAKAKPKPQSQNTESSAELSPVPDTAAQEDEPMQDLSDEEADDEDATMLDEGAITEPSGKTKKEREEELRRMMDMEDEPMADVSAKSSAAETPEEEPESKSESQAAEEPEETVTVSNGRRRGRRRVMKKKTVQDEEGYLVTREEPGWESFSEDEPVTKKPKVSAAPSAAKAKKAAPKGQGSIMSFFSKK